MSCVPRRAWHIFSRPQQALALAPPSPTPKETAQSSGPTTSSTTQKPTRSPDFRQPPPHCSIHCLTFNEEQTDLKPLRRVWKWIESSTSFFELFGVHRQKRNRLVIQFLGLITCELNSAQIHSALCFAAHACVRGSFSCGDFVSEQKEQPLGALCMSMLLAGGTCHKPDKPLLNI